MLFFILLLDFIEMDFCKAFENDPGEHTVCAQLTNKFLMFSKELG